MLDVEVLPPLGANSVNELHGLVIELKNRTQASCQLRGPAVELRPLDGADGFTNSFFSNQEMSPSERQFDQRHSELAPGAAAHLLIAWHSLDSPPFAGCLNRDSLALSFAVGAPPFLTVEHLWMRICDRAYVSRYRAGTYSGEPIAAEWLQRFEAHPTDFAPLPFLSAPTSLEPPVVLEADIERKMLHDYFPLSIDLPRPDPDCPFLVLRKREADGVTKVYMNQCQGVGSGLPDRLHLQPSQWTTWVPVPALGMQPEKTGIVEYDVFSRILHDGQPVYARSAKSVTVRDPTFPALPTIDSPFPECQAAQLQSTALPTLDGGKWHDAHIYDFTNISAQTCAVGGVPHLTFSHPEGKSYTWIPSPCPNCADPLFEPRPNGWIDLKPRESAHFIVGATRFNTESGRWRGICSIVDTLELSLSTDHPSISLPFGVGTCAQATISAWRLGKYDGDPKNLAYGKSAANRSPLHSGGCVQPDSQKLSRPVTITQGDGMVFALSASSESIPYGAPVLLRLWIDNQTGHEASVMTCSTLGVFWSEGFDVYDAYGHRLLKKKDHQGHGLPGANAANQDCQGVWVCSRNFPIPIPAHTCSSQTSFDFSQNLADSYDLPPGVYSIVPATPRDANMCRATIPRIDPAALADKLKITIEQN